MRSRRVLLLALVGMGACSNNNPAQDARRDAPVVQDRSSGSERLSGEGPAVDRPGKLDHAPATDLPPAQLDVVPATCGNGICQPLVGETTKNCPKDCPPPPAGCTNLATQYAQALQKAKSCSPASPTNPCNSVTVPSTVDCGCTTFISSSQAPAVTELQSLRAQYVKLGCPLCQTPTCVPVTTGLCKKTSTGGECMDVYAP